MEILRQGLAQSGMPPKFRRLLQKASRFTSRPPKPRPTNPDLLWINKAGPLKKGPGLGKPSVRGLAPDHITQGVDFFPQDFELQLIRGIGLAQFGGRLDRKAGVFLHLLQGHARMQ